VTYRKKLRPSRAGVATVRPSWPRCVWPYDIAEYDKIEREFLCCASRAGRRSPRRQWIRWWPRIQERAAQLALFRQMEDAPRSEYVRALERIAETGSLPSSPVAKRLGVTPGSTPLKVRQIARACLRQRAKATSRGHMREPLIEELALELLKAYASASGRAPGAAGDSFYRPGPAVRLLRAGLAPFTVIGPSGLRNLVRKIASGMSR
jgi:hypothetical protein